MRGRYVGPINTCFGSPVGEVSYGTEFILPVGRERAFLQRGYVEPPDKAAKPLYAEMICTSNDTVTPVTE